MRDKYLKSHCESSTHFHPIESNISLIFFTWRKLCNLIFKLSCCDRLRKCYWWVSECDCAPVLSRCDQYETCCPAVSKYFLPLSSYQNKSKWLECEKKKITYLSFGDKTALVYVLMQYTLYVCWLMHTCMCVCFRAETKGMPYLCQTFLSI